MGSIILNQNVRLKVQLNINEKAKEGSILKIN